MLACCLGSALLQPLVKKVHLIKGTCTAALALLKRTERYHLYTLNHLNDGRKMGAPDSLSMGLRSNPPTTSTAPRGLLGESVFASPDW